MAHIIRKSIASKNDNSNSFYNINGAWVKYGSNATKMPTEVALIILKLIQDSDFSESYNYVLVK